MSETSGTYGVAVHRNAGTGDYVVQFLGESEQLLEAERISPRDIDAAPPEPMPPERAAVYLALKRCLTSTASESGTDVVDVERALEGRDVLYHTRVEADTGDIVVEITADPGEAPTAIRVSRSELAHLPVETRPREIAIRLATRRRASRHRASESKP